MSSPGTPQAAGDLAVVAADGTRTTARWLASALGAVPSLAVLGALVRSPGDSGYEPVPLVLGVLLAAAGALVGVLGFARVLAPLSLESGDLDAVDLTRIPGQPHATADALRAGLQAAHDGARSIELRLLTENATAQEAEHQRVAAESEVTVAELAAEARPRNRAAANDLRAARTAAAARRRSAASAAAKVAALQHDLKVWQEQVRRAEQIQREAYQLCTADEVGARYTTARVLACVSVLLIAGGVLLLAFAPKPKPAAPAPQLLNLTLNDAGRDALGCDLPAVTAVRIGGPDNAPTVLTVPVPGCPARTVTFPAAAPTPYGSVSVLPTTKAP